MPSLWEEWLPEDADRLLQVMLKRPVTPFLGAGANLCGRLAPNGEWSPGTGSYPSGTELATHIADRMAYEGDDRGDLMLVATFAQGHIGPQWLSAELGRIFGEPVEPSELHRFLASYRRLAGEKGHTPPPPPPLIVTTNYDDALERALREQDEEFDVIAYVAYRGDDTVRQPRRFIHIPPGGEPILIEGPRSYLEADPDKRTVILKIHGTLAGDDRDWTSFVIAEEEYVDYLTVDIWDAIPAPLVARLSRSHLLFLGYSMRDWNLLVLLRRLGVLDSPGRGPYAGRKSWAFQLNPTDVDGHRWKRYDTTLYGVPLETMLGDLQRALAEL